MFRHMIGQDGTAKLYVAKNAHDLKEIHLSFIRVYLLEIAVAAANVTHVDLVDLAALSQVACNRQDVGSRVLQSFSGRAQTKLEAIVRAVDQGFVAFESIEDG